VSAHVQHERHPDRLVRPVQLLQCRAGEGDAALGLAGVIGRLHSFLEDPGVLGAYSLSRVRHLVPELKYACEQGEPLCVGDGLARLRRCLPGADERPGYVVRGIPVMGHLDGCPARRHEGMISVNRRGEASVQAAVLAWQQVLVHRLAD
jgi:hypothetical protein